MADNKIYLALGEETTRGTKQSTTVGFIPMDSAAIPKIAFNDKIRKDFRGEQTSLGPTAVRRMDQKWDFSLKTDFFTEAGNVKGMVGTLLKHFFGKVTSAQNGATGQYAHMLYPVADPFAAANLDTKALTLNLNINEGAVMKNWPFVGGRVKSLGFEQAMSEPLKLTADFFGQFMDTETAEVGSPVFAAENLRCDYNAGKLYTGTITRAGSAPDYTDMTFGSATQIKPDKVSVKIENGMTDVIRLGGVKYPDKTRMGQYKVTLDFTIDWADPASGFSSVTEFKAWVAAASATNFCLVWDTGTQAGTGGNHSLILDLPIMQRHGGEPAYSDKDPMISFKYEGLMDLTTCKYMVGLLLKNTASAV